MSAPAPAPLIVHVIHRLAVGGLENGLVNLINHLPEDRFRHAIVCLTDATDFRERIRRPDVRIVELHKSPGNSLSIHGRFYRTFRDLRPAIVHTRNLGALEAQLAAAVAGVPVRVHGEHGWDAAHPKGASGRHTAVRKLFSPLVHRYVALSGHIERYLTERVGIAGERIERICNGVDCQRFRPSPPARAAFPYPRFRDPALVLVGTIGRLAPVKDQLTLARAFVETLARKPAMRRFLRLAIVGAGPLREEIERILIEGDAADLSWLPGARSDVADLLPAFDAFVLPSQAEGISNTILEAMACGVPVIATSVGGNVELVASGETGELVPANDPSAMAAALLRCASDPQRQARLGAAARVRALTQFSIDDMVRRYAALYDRELGRRTPHDRTGVARARRATVE